MARLDTDFHQLQSVHQGGTVDHQLQDLIAKPHEVRKDPSNHEHIRYQVSACCGALAIAVELNVLEKEIQLLYHDSNKTLASGQCCSAMHYSTGNALIDRRQLVYGHHHEEAAAKRIRRLKLFACNVHGQDRFDNTPLHEALCLPLNYDDIYVFETPLIADASRDAQNRDGDTANYPAVKLSMVDTPNRGSSEDASP